MIDDDPRERETLPPPSPDDEPTRELRRLAYIAGSADTALGAVLSAQDRPAQLSAISYHLGLAWDDGAAREADLRTAVGVLRSEVHAMRAAHREEASMLAAMIESIQRIAAEQREEITRLREEVHTLRTELEQHRDRERARRATPIAGTPAGGEP